MVQLRSIATLTVLAATAAFADLPPPADDYIGPKHVTLAGLNFEHRLDHYSRVIDHVKNPSFVLLVGCEGASYNCDAVTKAGVIDWEVVSVDGKPVVQGDLNAVIAAFRSGTGPVAAVFSRRAQPPRTVTLKVERK